ncbi:MAG: DnaJ domain-containing protein [Paludibacteraceae bacterium]|nr:DnaJ domain-containing protein [Paludibacteraceae bacterium]
MKPYYAILGIAEDASDKDIKKAYHKLALQYHPDLLKNVDRVKECDAKMAKINEAYDKVRGKIC